MYALPVNAGTTSQSAYRATQVISAEKQKAQTAARDESQSDAVDVQVHTGVKQYAYAEALQRNLDAHTHLALNLFDRNGDKTIDARDVLYKKSTSNGAQVTAATAAARYEKTATGE